MFDIQKYGYLNEGGNRTNRREVLRKAAALKKLPGNYNENYHPKEITHSEVDF